MDLKTLVDKADRQEKFTEKDLKTIDPSKITPEDWQYLSEKTKFTNPNPSQALFLAYIDTKKNFFRYVQDYLGIPTNNQKLHDSIVKELEKTISTNREQLTRRIRTLGKNIQQLNNLDFIKLDEITETCYDKTPGEIRNKLYTQVAKEIALKLQAEGLTVEQEQTKKTASIRRINYVVQYLDDCRVVVHNCSKKHSCEVDTLLSYKGIPLAIQKHTKKKKNEETRRKNQADIITKLYGSTPHIINIIAGHQEKFQEKIRTINNTGNHYLIELPIKQELDYLTQEVRKRL